MTEQFYPEAYYSKTNLKGMKIVPFETAVVGTAIHFDKRSRLIIVDLGNSWIGVIPENEATVCNFSYSGDNPTPIQITYMIGMQIRAIVTNVLGKKLLQLSRKLSMRQAWNALEEGSNIKACITRNMGYGLFFDIGNGLTSYCKKNDCASTIISDTNIWFKENEFVNLKILDKGISESSIITCSLKLAYPSIKEAASFLSVNDVIIVKIGMTKTNTQDGYYCQYTPNISGIVDTNKELKEGETVRVLVKKITEKGLKLRLIR